MARQVGDKNARTKAWEKLGGFMLDKGSTRMLAIMKGMSDKEFTDVYLKLVQFWRPRMQSTQLRSEGTTTIHLVSEQELLDKI